jgi:HSP20 family protein
MSVFNNSLQRLQQELERAFDNPFGSELASSARGAYPPVNLFTSDDECVVRFEIPGVPPEELSIESLGRSLTVSGKRESAVPTEGRFHRRDRWTGEFRRTLALPAEFELSKAVAEHENGVLTLRVPRKEDAKPRLITINAQ